MNEKSKKSVFKKWWFWVIVVIIAIAILGSGEDSSTPTAVDDTSTENLSTAEPAPEEEQPKEFKIGDVVQMDEYKLTVLEVNKSKGNDFDTPKQGMEYVIVTVKIENGGKDKISYNPFDFKMINSQGQITDTSLTIIDTETRLNSGELMAGGNVSGTIVFEQPIDDPKLQLQYQPSFWSDDSIIVNLQ